MQLVKLDKARLIDEIAESAFKGKRELLESLSLRALKEGIPAQQIVTQGFMVGMRDVGLMHEQGRIFTNDMLISAIAVANAMATIRPHIARDNIKPLGTFVIGAVLGDIHDLGKNIVGMVMEGFGFNVIDVGVNVSAEEFVRVALRHNAGIIGMSALLSTTRINIAPIIKFIRESRLGDRVKIMVGGAAVTETFADSVGADGYGIDAWEAAERAKKLIGVSPT